MKEREIMEKVDEGHILAKIIIEVLGKPKEHVEETLKLVIDKTKKLEDVDLLKKKINDTKEQEGGLFSTFSEMEILTKNMNTLFSFCLDFMPSSVDILEPVQHNLEVGDLNALLNDFLANLHKIDMLTKNFKMENNLLKKNVRTLLTNLIVISLKQKSKTESQLAKHIGVGTDKIGLFLNELEKNKIIKKRDDQYEIAK